MSYSKPITRQEFLILEPLGKICVDSGCISIIDPCYTSGNEQSKGFNDWTKFCATDISGGAEYNGGFAVDTIHGDGVYWVYKVSSAGGTHIGYLVDLQQLYDPDDNGN